MKEKIRYTKTGKKIEIYEFDARLHKKIVMKKSQFEDHIVPKHPEMTLEIIEEVLRKPDFVTKQSKSRKEHFYQKEINRKKYFVVVSSSDNVKNLRFILTAFAVNDESFLKEKNIYYRYRK